MVKRRHASEELGSDRAFAKAEKSLLFSNSPALPLSSSGCLPLEPAGAALQKIDEFLLVARQAWEDSQRLLIG
jgi:hypothetical protein